MKVLIEFITEIGKKHIMHILGMGSSENYNKNDFHSYL